MYSGHQGLHPKVMAGMVPQMPTQMAPQSHSQQLQHMRLLADIAKCLKFKEAFMALIHGPQQHNRNLGQDISKGQAGPIKVLSALVYCLSPRDLTGKSVTPTGMALKSDLTCGKLGSTPQVRKWYSLLGFTKDTIFPGETLGRAPDITIIQLQPFSYLITRYQDTRSLVDALVRKGRLSISRLAYKHVQLEDVVQGRLELAGSDLKRLLGSEVLAAADRFMAASLPHAFSANHPPQQQQQRQQQEVSEEARAATADVEGHIFKLECLIGKELNKTGSGSGSPVTPNTTAEESSPSKAGAGAALGVGGKGSQPPTKQQQEQQQQQHAQVLKEHYVDGSFEERDGPGGIHSKRPRTIQQHSFPAAPPAPAPTAVQNENKGGEAGHRFQELVRQHMRLTLEEQLTLDFMQQENGEAFFRAAIEVVEGAENPGLEIVGILHPYVEMMKMIRDQKLQALKNKLMLVKEVGKNDY